MRLRAAHLAGTCALLVAFALPSRASAFLRTTGCRDLPLVWPSTCAYYGLDAAGSDDVAIAGLESSVRGSFNTWQAVAGSYLTFEYQGLVSGLEPGWMGGGPQENVIIWIETDWARAFLDPEDVSRPAGAIALTTVFFLPSDGELEQIIGADMELNGEQFIFTIANEPAQVMTDVANTVTHEAGHVLGLNHNCFEFGSGLGAGDAPPCLGNPDLVEATMYWNAQPGEISKRSLEADDIAGIIDIYPLADRPETCEPPGFVDPGGGEGCSCSTVAAASHRRGSRWVHVACVLGVLALGLIRMRRRRCAKPRRWVRTSSLTLSGMLK